ncbi:CU044_2847 family protein [Streptomyces sp. NPDC017993]|uniref:CU044_2847 family protein n=1 Tax=Streptomyces sp. NPDC017993 TaxID=3365027 RepID=UPI003791ECFA
MGEQEAVMQDRAQRIALPDGTEVWARVSRLDVADPDDPADPDAGDFEDVGAWDALGARVEGLREVIGGVAASVRQATERVAPHETSVTFGVEVSAKPGKAVALLADGEAKANLSVTLTWRREDGPPAPEVPPRPADGREPADAGR